MNSARRNVLTIALLALLATIAMAFLWPTIAERPQPTPVHAAEKLTIAINSPYIASGLVHLAARKGYFAVEGLDVTLQPHDSGRSALDAVVADRADIATVADTPVVFAVINGVPLAIVATISNAVRSHGIVARRDRGISVLADLKGRRVGVVSGSDAHYLLHTMLASHGVAPNEIAIENLKSAELTFALAEGRVDAIATWEPWLSEARKAAGANGVVFEPDKGFSLAFNLVGRRKFVQSHPAVMQRLLRALLAAERFLGTDPEAARALVLDATKIESTVFDNAWPNHFLRLTLSQGTVTMLEDQARWVNSISYGEKLKIPNFLESIYLDAMLAVKPQAVSIIR